MVIVDKKMPEKCAGCWAMRCSKCIISDSKNIMEYQSNGTKPAWCPVKEDADKIVIGLENELEYTRDMGNDEWFNGKKRVLESAIRKVKQYVEKVESEE